MNCKCEPIYARHVCHMTGEGLHDKSAIAAELAHRDIQIEDLTDALRIANRQIGELNREADEHAANLAAAKMAFAKNYRSAGCSCCRDEDEYVNTCEPS